MRRTQFTHFAFKARG